jgi:transcriptional regulator with XRE-family HTH domain
MAMTFGMKTRVMRQIRNMSQQDLMDEAGTHRMIIWQLESDQVQPAQDMAYRIRKALGWTPAVDRALDALGVALDEEGGYCTAES